MAMPLKQLKDIPTIAYLYRTKVLRQSSNTDLLKGTQESNDKICTIQYDITKLEVDAIVNAANKSLLGGGGVDGAIHAAAGPALLDECRGLNGCATGSAKITDAYNLPCKKVIHAVGPIYYNADQAEPLLRGCYKTALQLSVDNGCKSIAFSAISTGIYGYPSNAASRAALREVASFLRRPEGENIEKVVFCNFLEKDVKAYTAAIP